MSRQATPLRHWSWMAALSSLLLATGVLAQDSGREATPDQTHRAQVERLRAEIANKIYLQANDLVDELVFGWLETPPFGNITPVVLADVIAPVGFGSGLEALIENHLSQVLIKNPGTNVQLAHCPSCNALIVHSDSKGTVIARGVDQPKALAQLRSDTSAQHALFLDFEAEGSSLVLRARLTKLNDTLPIVYARTLTTRTSSAPLLRRPDHLISAEEARAEYLAVLEERGPLTIPVKMVLTGFAPAEDAALNSPLPVPWLQVGAEYAISSARAWTGNLTVGATFIPTLQTGAMVQVRAARLVTGSAISLTHPNVYLFVGAALALLQGQIASVLNPPAVPPPAGGEVFGPIATYLSFQTGLEMRVSRRIGVTFMMETMPTLYQSDNVGNYLDMIGLGIDFGIIQINSIGAEASFAF